jgi:hypothetical protein
MCENKPVTSLNSLFDEIQVKTGFKKDLEFSGRDYFLFANLTSEVNPLRNSFLKNLNPLKCSTPN